MLWTFVDACVRGQLPFAECGPVYSLAGIGVFLIVAVVALVVLLRGRRARPD